MADGAPGFFEFVEQAREFFDGKQPPKGQQSPPEDVIDVEPTVVEVVDAHVAGEAQPAPTPSSATSGPGFTLHVSPEHLLERLAWVISTADQFHEEVVRAKASEAFSNAWKLWYRDILVWRKRIEGNKGVNATKADYDKLDAILQRLGKWHAKLDKDRHALDEKKGDGLPWYAWAAILVGGAYAAKEVFSGFISDMVS